MNLRKVRRSHLNRSPRELPIRRREIMDSGRMQLLGRIPLSSDDRWGDVATVQKLTAEDCRKFHASTLRPTNMALAFGGYRCGRHRGAAEKPSGSLPRAAKDQLAQVCRESASSPKTSQHLTHGSRTRRCHHGVSDVTFYAHETRAADRSARRLLTGGPEAPVGAI